MKNRGTLLALMLIFAVLTVFLVVQNSQIENHANNVLTPSGLQLNEDAGIQRVYNDISESDIQAFRIEDPLTQQQITMQRNPAGEWQIPTDATLEIDQEVAEGIAKTISLMPYTDTIGGVEPDKYGEFGLNQRDALLFILFTTGDGEPHVVAIGNLTSTRDGYYALVDDRQDIYVISREPDPIAFMLYYLNNSEAERQN